MSQFVKPHELESLQAYSQLAPAEETHPSDERTDEVEDFKRCAECFKPLTTDEEENDMCASCEEVL